MTDSTSSSSPESIPKNIESTSRPPRATGVIRRLPDGTVIRANIEDDGSVFLFCHGPGGTRHPLRVDHKYLYLLSQLIAEAYDAIQNAPHESEG